MTGARARVCQAFATERSSWEAAQTAVKRRHEVEEYALRVYCMFTTCALLQMHRMSKCTCACACACNIHMSHVHVHVHPQAELEEGRGGWDEQRRALEKRLAREQKAAADELRREKKAKADLEAQVRRGSSTLSPHPARARFPALSATPPPLDDPPSRLRSSPTTQRRSASVASSGRGRSRAG